MILLQWVTYKMCQSRISSFRQGTPYAYMPSIAADYSLRGALSFKWFCPAGSGTNVLQYSNGYVSCFPNLQV